MKMTDLRAKARAIFGSAIAEPMPNQPNGAAALQKRANARPIPTYKDGGAIKKLPTKLPRKDESGIRKLPTKLPNKDDSGIKMLSPEALNRNPAVKTTKPANAPKMVDFEPRQPKTGKAPANAPKPIDMLSKEELNRNPAAKRFTTVPKPPKSGPEADDVLITTRRGQQILDAQKRREMEMDAERRKKQAAADKLLGVTMKKGGKVQTSSDTARKLAKEMGGMKKGGKPKTGLAVMIAIGKTKPIKEKATGEMYASKAAMKKHEAKETPAMQRAERKMNGGAANMRDTDYEGSKVTRAMKMAVGGAGKTRKGMAPIKKAQGGAAKVRKGMMSPTGDIKQVVKPKKGIGF